MMGINMYKPSKIGWFMALFYPHIPWFAGISLLPRPYTSSPALLATATRPPGRWGCAPARGPGRWRSKEDWKGFLKGILGRIFGGFWGGFLGGFLEGIFGGWFLVEIFGGFWVGFWGGFLRGFLVEFLGVILGVIFLGKFWGEFLRVFVGIFLGGIFGWIFGGNFWGDFGGKFWGEFWSNFLGDFGVDFNGIQIVQWGLMGFQWDFHGTLMGFTNMDFRSVDISENQQKDCFMAWYTMIYPNHICAISYNWLADWEAPPTSHFTPEKNLLRKTSAGSSWQKNLTRSRGPQGGAPNKWSHFLCYGARVHGDPCWSVFME